METTRQRRYNIYPGQQYDLQGVSVEHGHGHLQANYSADGTWSHGHPVLHDDLEVVLQGVQRVLATRTAETITMGAAPSAEEQSRLRLMLLDHEQYEEDWHAGKIV